MNYIKIILVLVIIAGAIFYLESQKTPRLKPADLDLSKLNLPTSEGIEKIDKAVELKTDIVVEKSKKYQKAKEIINPDGYINTDGITVGELIGKKVIMIDFWTYSCINCQRTLPYLNNWYEKYADQGLEIIGIHTPEFEFEKEYENVVRAVEKYGVKYPVVQDNNYYTWSNYNNRYWPHKFIIDIDGFIVYDHIGEGGYDETEAKIVELLKERKERLGLNDSEEVMSDNSGPKNVDVVVSSKVKTPETYLGSKRTQYLVNLPKKSCLTGSCEYVLPESVNLNTYALGGKWKTEEENIILESDSGSIVIGFSANKVNLVAGSDVPVKADIYLDGEKKGSIEFQEHDLYNLIDLGGEYGQHILEIRFLEKGIGAFAFTFG